MKIFQFYFFTNGMASPHGCWLSVGVRQLKRAKRISVIFSLLDLKWIPDKNQAYEIKGY